MKFRCKLVDGTAMRDFTNIINTISRMAKQCVLRITPQGLNFKVGDNRLPTVWAEISEEHFFTEYMMHGVSEENNEIYLHLDATMLARTLGSLRMTAKSAKLKLTHKREPCLTLEVVMPSLAVNTRHCIHDVPVKVIPRKEWPEHQAPNISNFDVSIGMPELRYIRFVVERMKNMSSQITLIADHSGEFIFKVETDSATVSTHFRALQVSSINETQEDEKVSVTVNIKKFSMFTLWDILHPTSVKCNMLNNRMINVSIQLDNRLKINNFIPALKV